MLTAPPRSLQFLALAVMAIAPATAAVLDDPALTVQTVVTGLVAPSGMAFIGDGDILVLQQLDGTVHRIVGGVLLPDPVLDLPVDTVLLDRGLLGIAIDPDFLNNHYVYLDYVEATSDGGTTVGSRVTRFRWDGAALVEPLILLTPPIRPTAFRVGGKVIFGADDMLYTVMGDLQLNTKLQNNPNGADPNDTSVIFRTTSLGAAPPDNPFAGSSGPLQPMNRYFAYGIRNSFGLAVDPVTGDLWDTENGQAIYDEINRVEPGMNSGWNRIQGPDARDPDDVPSLWMAPGAHYSDPEFSWAVPVAPTAITFVKNSLLGCERRYDVLVAGTNCGTIEHLKPNASRTGFVFTAPELTDLVADNNADTCAGEQAEISFGSDFGIVTDAVTGPDGFLYVLSSDQGTLYRIVPSWGAGVDADSDGAPDACDCQPTDAGAWLAPGEVRRLRLSGTTPTLLGWDDPRSAIGPTAVYSVVSGRLSDIRSSGGFASSCRLGGLLTTAAAIDSRPAPAPGDGFYYLVRTSNACGAGTFGESGNFPDPRDLLDAASFPACP